MGALRLDPDAEQLTTVGSVSDAGHGGPSGVLAADGLGNRRHLVNILAWGGWDSIWFHNGVVKAELQGIINETQGYIMNALDRCCLALPGDVSGAPTRGVVMLEMDDVMSAGDEEHERRMAAIAKQVQFGKDVYLQDEPDGALFNGRRWWQNSEFDVLYSMDEFVATRLSPVPLERRRRKPGSPGEENKFIEVEITTREAAHVTQSILLMVWNDRS